MGRSIATLVGKSHRLRRAAPVHTFPLPETLMGVELEAEAVTGASLPHQNSLLNWNRVRDGSLQNGWEYVLRQPMAGDSLSIAITELMGAGRYLRSPTGSTHIHMDMLEEEDSDELLQVIMLLVFILEPMLYNSGDASRAYCGYANRLFTAPDSTLATVLRPDVSEEVFQRTYSRNSSGNSRYYGFNMAALIDYGSVEFRYFPTAESEEELVRWVSLVQSFKVAARGIANVSSLRSIMENEEAFMSMMEEYFGPYRQYWESISFKEAREALRKVLLVSDINNNANANAAYTPDYARAITHDRFEGLLQDPSTVPPLLNIIDIREGQSIPQAIDAPVNSVMVYSSTIYFRNFNGRAANWEPVYYLPYDMIPVSVRGRFIATMRHILSSASTYNRELVNNLNIHQNYIRDFVRHTTGVVGADPHPIYVEPEEPDYDDEPYDPSDEEDDE